MLRQVLTIAGAELQRRLRSKSALITAFAAPLAMAVVFGLMLGNSSGDGPAFVIGVVDGGGTPQSAGIVASLVSATGEQGVSFNKLDDLVQAEIEVDDEVVYAAIVVGSGNDVPELTVITNPANPLSSQVAQSVASSIATSIETDGAPSVELQPLAVGGRAFDDAAFFGASMAILLLFFATGAAAQSVLEDKENRTLDRMLSGPTTLWSILIGKVVAVSVMAIASFVVVWQVTTLLFGAQWGSAPAVLALIVFTVIALSGVATFVGGLASTAQQATTLTAVVTFGLSLLGGNFTGPADAPAALRSIRPFTPNGRALDAFTRVSVDSSSLGSIASTLVVLLAIGLAFGAVGLLSVRRRILS